MKKLKHQTGMTTLTFGETTLHFVSDALLEETPSHLFLVYLFRYFLAGT